MKRDEIIQAHVVVRGLVQGVFFRQSTAKQALAAGVVGWVRNLPDGSVEARLEGARAEVEQVLEFVRIGPAAARVDDVSVTLHPPCGEFETFEVKR